MKRSILALIIGLCLPCYGQSIVPQLPNTIQVGVEGVTVTAISIPTAALQFGVASTWVTINTPVLPFAAYCYSGCPAQVGKDPASGISKLLVAVEQTKPYTITLSSGTVIQVPAVSYRCDVPIAFNANPVLPTSSQICPPLAGLSPVVGDGATIIDWLVSTPVIYQYCSVANHNLCSPPFMLIANHMEINPTSVWMGGDPDTTSNKHTLFALNMILPNTLIYTLDSDPAHTPTSVVIPAATP